jgi:hypothetical protein
MKQQPVRIPHPIRFYDHLRSAVTWPTTVDAFIHITLNSGDARISPRSEVRDDVIEMLKPIVDAGGGEISALHVVFESASVFTLGWQPDAPAVRCYLAKEPNPALWKQTEGERSEPTGSWLAVRLLPGALHCTTDQIMMLGDAERCVAWAIIETLPN